MDWGRATADHLCIVWCNQLVVSIVRSLFDMVPDKAKRITENVYARREALWFHLVQNSGVKSLDRAPRLRDPRVRFGNMKEIRLLQNTHNAQV